MVTSAILQDKVYETYGECTKCGTEALLGNGLCLECWDKIINRTVYLHIKPPTSYENRPVCPICGSNKHTNKNGTSNGKTRYLCSKCKKSY